ncbi:MAG: hypothetical protein IH827_04495 [Myxococcales bacterium]|nr:hypothetical protein [Myxococcales bacterium]
MAADLFDFAAERLEHHTGFSQLEARGTLRIALKVAGLDPSAFTAGQLCVVFEKVMPGELDSRGVSDVQDACAAVLADLESAGGAAEDASATSPDEIFRRLAGG